MTIGDFVVVLNPAQAWVDTFEVVLHELAHALLGHGGSRPSVRQAPRLVAIRGRRSHDARELEASSSSLAVTLRRGGRAGSQLARVLRHFDGLRSADALKSVDLLGVFRATELLAAWCRMRPHSVGGAVLVSPGTR